MSKLERKVMNVYGENAAERDIIAYGSDIAGNIVQSKDPDVIQTQAYSNGVRSAVVGSNSTTLQNRMALDFLFSRQLKYLFQKGVPEWKETETYYIGSFVSDGNGRLFASLTDNNIGNEVTDETNWASFPTPEDLRILDEKISSKGHLIGEVFYSQSSSASDNPGALPLFTGETISSADTIYPDFYAWVESHTELQTTAEEYETALSTCGECAKYVVSNGSLRLPKLTNYIKMANTAEGITQSEAGLPNITGQTNFAPNAGMRNDAQPRGAFYKATETGNITSFNQAAGNDLGFDASLSNPIYGNSDTVTPAHTTLYPWVCAYNEVIPESFANATQFIDALSGKADTNLSNTYPDKNFRENVFNWGLPDYTAGVTKSWNTDITAETNGWVNVKSYTIQGGTASCLTINGVEVYKLWCGFDAQVGYQNMWPVYKGDVYKATGGNSGQTITFYPCKGEVL